MASSSRACPPQAESWCSSPRATTECEFDLACKPRLPNRLEPEIAKRQPKGRCANTSPRPCKPDGVLDQVKAKPLRGGPAGRPWLDLRAPSPYFHGRDEELVSNRTKSCNPQPGQRWRWIASSRRCSQAMTGSRQPHPALRARAGERCAFLAVRCALRRAGERARRFAEPRPFRLC